MLQESVNLYLPLCEQTGQGKIILKSCYILWRFLKFFSCFLVFPGILVGLRVEDCFHE